jgi:hypothetical protein
MTKCDRESKVAFLSAQELASAEWTDHVATCRACRDELQLRSYLQADGEALGRAAGLSTPAQALWRAKLRMGRNQRRRVATLVSFMEAAAGGILTFVLLGLMWSNLGVSPAEDHPVTIIVCGLVTILAFGVLALVAFYAGPWDSADGQRVR